LTPSYFIATGFVREPGGMIYVRAGSVVLGGMINDPGGVLDGNHEILDY
jgi:hypothetical protein